MFKLVVSFCILALAAAKPAFLVPGYLAPAAYSPLAYSAPVLTGPLSLAPGQPAGILGADGRPLDTLDVNVARQQHYAAKAYEGTGIHLLKKRSVAALPLAHAPFYPAPLAYSAPLGYSAPLTYPAQLTYPSYHGYAPSTIVHSW